MTTQHWILGLMLATIVFSVALELRVEDFARVVKTAPVTSEATSIGPDTPNLEQVELVVTEPMQAEPGKEQVPEAIVVKDDGADAGPKRSGWWSRNAAKLFGV